MGRFLVAACLGGDRTESGIEVEGQARPGQVPEIEAMAVFSGGGGGSGVSGWSDPGGGCMYVCTYGYVCTSVVLRVVGGVVRVLNRKQTSMLTASSAPAQPSPVHPHTWAGY